MQRVLSRNLLARNQALKQSRRRNEKQLKEKLRNIKQGTIVRGRLERSNIKAEQTNRREDWMLGPLAPNRLIGKDGGNYGLLPTEAIRPPEVLERDRPKFFNFAVNDRVVVVKGRERGKIGKVKDIDLDMQTVTLAGINMVDVKVPSMLRRENEEAVPFQATAVPLRIQDVRLVIPLWDHVTGEVKDTVVEEVRGGTPIVEPEYGSNRPTHTRYIAGPENIEIPWPEAEMTEHKAEAADTLRVHVDEMSYFLSLTHLPMPESVIDELRNKYSRSRNNHEQVYVQKKMREDAKEQWKNRRRMVLPQQEYWEHKAKQKDTQAQPEVTQETLELIREMQAASLGTSRQRETGVSS